MFFFFSKKDFGYSEGPFYFHMNFGITPYTLDLSGNLDSCYKDSLESGVLRPGADSKAVKTCVWKPDAQDVCSRRKTPAAALLALAHRQPHIAVIIAVIHVS